MDLKEFVSSAIVDISEGVSEADKKIEDIGGLVNPGTHSKNKIDDNFIHARTTIDFDIAISAGSENSGSGEAKAKIWVIEASAGGKKLSKSEVVSRLSFSVDVVLPAPINQKSRVGMVRLPNK